MSDFPRDSEASLVCLYYPQQLIPALTAVLTFRRYRGEDESAPLTVLVWSAPSIDRKIRERRLQAFRVLLERFPWARLYYPDAEEITRGLSHKTRVSKKAAYLREKFGYDAFTAIYYAHDVSADYIAQSAMQAFPQAKRICFGDALGVVYSNEHFTKTTYPLGGSGQLPWRIANMVFNWMARLRRAWVLPSAKYHMDAEYAVLLLPCDPAGDYLADKTSLAVDEETLGRVLGALSGAASGHIPGSERCLAPNAGTAYIMLLGSYSESKLTTESLELELYLEVARQHVVPGSQLILKPHPVSADAKIERILAALADTYSVDVTRYNEFPIEVLPWLATHPNVLSFSYSSVSLRFLYGNRVTHAMTPDLIRRYFPEHSIRWMLDSNALYMQQKSIATQLHKK